MRRILRRRFGFFTIALGLGATTSLAVISCGSNTVFQKNLTENSATSYIVFFTDSKTNQAAATPAKLIWDLNTELQEDVARLTGVNRSNINLRVSNDNYYKNGFQKLAYDLAYNLDSHGEGIPPVFQAGNYMLAPLAKPNAVKTATFENLSEYLIQIGDQPFNSINLQKTFKAALEADGADDQERLKNFFTVFDTYYRAIPLGVSQDVSADSVTVALAGIQGYTPDDGLINLPTNAVKADPTTDLKAYTIDANGEYQLVTIKDSKIYDAASQTEAYNSFFALPDFKAKGAE